MRAAGLHKYSFIILSCWSVCWPVYWPVSVLISVLTSVLISVLISVLTRVCWVWLFKAIWRRFEGKCSFKQGLALSKYLLSQSYHQRGPALQHCNMHIQTWKLLENIVYKSWPNLHASKLYAGFFEMQNISHFYISSRPFSCLIN